MSEVRRHVHGDLHLVLSDSVVGHQVGHDVGREAHDSQVEEVVPAVPRVQSDGAAENDPIVVEGVEIEHLRALLVQQPEDADRKSDLAADERAEVGHRQRREVDLLEQRHHVVVERAVEREALTEIKQILTCSVYPTCSVYLQSHTW